eukprot:CAMPEP_0114275844 /NCGR_PEP_ID=MMETSP0058-20121206/30551_1 /TAXON_ID=36894 /ORGANISM="Pyramimonas parkeae, CCMP726" /LENGTH=56 /DNA_ID=CAMNT_0001395801 /DNA_START=138 /DNA_END=308 /DNA_ORIENTATION=+
MAKVKQPFNLANLGRCWSTICVFGQHAINEPNQVPGICANGDLVMVAHLNLGGEIA